MNAKVLTFSTLFFLTASLIGCGNPSQPKQEIKPAQKLSSDASEVANEAWVLINQLDHILYAHQTEHLDEMVRKPLRELSTRWRIEVKMTDAVAEGKYALCRKSLNSLDAWARASIDNDATIVAKQTEYERDKALCKDAIEHPELGNTAP